MCAFEFAPSTVAKKLVCFGSALPFAMLTGDSEVGVVLMLDSVPSCVGALCGVRGAFGFEYVKLYPVGEGRRSSVPVDESFDFELHGFDPQIAFRYEGPLFDGDGGSEADE